MPDELLTLTSDEVIPVLITPPGGEPGATSDPNAPELEVIPSQPETAEPAPKDPETGEPSEGPDASAADAPESPADDAAAGEEPEAGGPGEEPEGPPEGGAGAGGEPGEEPEAEPGEPGAAPPGEPGEPGEAPAGAAPPGPSVQLPPEGTEPGEPQRPQVPGAGPEEPEGEEPEGGEAPQPSSSDVTSPEDEPTKKPRNTLPERDAPLSDAEKADLLSQMQDAIDNVIDNPEEAENLEHQDDPFTSDVDDLNDPLLDNAADTPDQDAVTDGINEVLDREDADRKIKANIEADNDIDDVQNALASLSDKEIEGKVDLKVRGIKLKKKGNWKAMLKQLLLTALGQADEWDPARKSRKVKGVWGAEREEEAFQTIGIIMDSSGSMGLPKYRKAIKAVDEIITKARLKKLQMHVCVFADQSAYKKFMRYNRQKLEAYLTACKMQLGGSTNFYGATKLWKMKVKRPLDAILVFSDMEFTNDPKGAGRLLRRYRSRIIWVAVELSPYGVDKIKKVDPGYKSRLVKVV